MSGAYYGQTTITQSHLRNRRSDQNLARYKAKIEQENRSKYRIEIEVVACTSQQVLYFKMLFVRLALSVFAFKADHGQFWQFFLT